MARQTMKDQRPSSDQEFADKVQGGLAAVERLHGSLLPALRKLFTKVLGREVEVEICEAHQRMFGYYIQSLGRYCCDYCFTMAPLEGRVYLDLSLPLCAAVLRPDADDEAITRKVESSPLTCCPWPWRWSSSWTSRAATRSMSSRSTKRATARCCPSVSNGPPWEPPADKTAPRSAPRCSTPPSECSPGRGRAA